MQARKRNQTLEYRALHVTLALLALVVIAAFTSSKATLIVAVIVSGAFVGLDNILTTHKRRNRTKGETNGQTNRICR